MWLNIQNLGMSRKDKSGNTWHFRYWEDSRNDQRTQRIFFWNTDKTETGMLELFSPHLNRDRVKQTIAKIVSSPDYRQQYQKSLLFPLERHY